MQLIEEIKSKLGEKGFLIFGLGVAFHLLSVIFSEGFHRPDEHLGIMRFVGFNLGVLNESQALSSWEYPAKIRPWLQPMLYSWILTIPYKLGLENPFHLSFILRILSSILALWTSYRLFIAGEKFLKSEIGKLTLVLGLFALWFLPFFHARTSAENLSSSLFMWGLALFIEKISSLSEESEFSGSLFDITLIGFLWGTSFIFRYQTIALSLPILIWCLFKISNKWKVIGLGTLGFLLIQILSVPVDYIGYGEWTFPPYNYFYENIVNGKASQFGTDPFWYYITKGLSRGIPPVSVLILVSTLWFFFKKKMSLLTWSGLCFIIIHSMVSHKEIRFILPMASLFAFYMAFFTEKYHQKIPRWVFIILLVTNFGALAFSSIKPAHNPIGFYKYMYESSEKIEVVFTKNVVRDQLFFYQKNQIEMIHFKEYEELKGHQSWVLVDRLFEGRELEKKGCSPKYSPFPRFIEDLFIKFEKNKRMWILLSCEGQKS